MDLDKLVKIYNYLYNNNYSCFLSYHFNKYCFTINKYNSYDFLNMKLNFNCLKNDVYRNFTVPTNKKILANINSSVFMINKVENNKKLLIYILILSIIHSIVNNDKLKE